MVSETKMNRHMEVGPTSKGRNVAHVIVRTRIEYRQRTDGFMLGLASIERNTLEFAVVGCSFVGSFVGKLWWTAQTV